MDTFLNWYLGLAIVWGIVGAVWSLIATLNWRFDRDLYSGRQHKDKRAAAANYLRVALVFFVHTPIFPWYIFKWIRNIVTGNTNNSWVKQWKEDFYGS